MKTNKQQALEELAAVMDKWDIDFIAYDDGTVEMDIDHESVISTHGIICAETIQKELNRMKECQK